MCLSQSSPLNRILACLDIRTTLLGYADQLRRPRRPRRRNRQLQTNIPPGPLRRLITVPSCQTVPRCWPTESQDGPNGEFCGPKPCIRCGLFKMSQSRLIIS
jgi:hypothetical protein